MYHGVTLKILGREINPGGKAVRPGEAGGGEEERGRRRGSGFWLSSWWGWQRSGGLPGVGVARSNPAASGSTGIVQPSGSWASATEWVWQRARGMHSAWNMPQVLGGTSASRLHNFDFYLAVPLGSWRQEARKQSVAGSSGCIQEVSPVAVSNELCHGQTPQKKLIIFLH